MKSEGVMDVVVWLKKEVRKAKKELDSVKKEFSDYDISVIEAQANLNALVRVKIKTERYAKKLKYQEKDQ